MTNARFDALASKTPARRGGRFRHTERGSIGFCLVRVCPLRDRGADFQEGPPGRPLSTAGPAGAGSALVMDGPPGRTTCGVTVPPINDATIARRTSIGYPFRPRGQSEPGETSRYQLEYSIGQRAPGTILPMVIKWAAMLACCYRPQQRSRIQGGWGVGIRLDVQAEERKGSSVVRELQSSLVAARRSGLHLPNSPNAQRTSVTLRL
jgi:hypothetical protein